MYKRENKFPVKRNFLTCMAKLRIQSKLFALYSLSSLFVLVALKSTMFTY